jgi:hypothetical protein
MGDARRGEVREEIPCASKAPRGAWLDKQLDPRTDPGDYRREPTVDGERETLLHLGCRLAMLLLSANVSFVHTEHTRASAMPRGPGNTAPHADP